MNLKNKIVAIGAILLFLSCKTNPFTGKKTLALVSNNDIFPTAFAQYNQFLTENNVVTGTSEANMIKNVGQKIAVASERWLDANGYQGYLKDYKWEFNLVKDETINAWCMPGGKIVFYTGILPIADGEAGVAAIMGHEVAHALANHGQQRMSAGQIQQAAGAVGMLAVGDDQQSQELFATAYGIGSQVGVMLPFSRKHETEADRIGIKLMAIAGYDPDEAAKLWMRMKENSDGAGPPPFLSTHPSNNERIQNLRKWSDDAKKVAAKYGVTSFEN